MARVVRFHELGGPEVLKIEEIEVPQPKTGEVRIHVKSLGLNRAEALFRAGRYTEKASFPSRLGYEASGIVESIGEGVSGFKIGDAVSNIPVPNQGKYGVYGDLALIPAECLIKIPPNLTFDDATSIWMQYLTAYGALIEISKIERGEFVVITAASSSVGIAAIQLCRLFGAIPIATTRTAPKKKHLIEVGAEHVIVTDEESLKDRILDITNGKGARVAFDPIGGKPLLSLADGMSAGGTIIEYGSLSGEATPYPLVAALTKGLSIRGYMLFELIKNGPARDRAVKYILGALDSNSLKPIIDKTFPFEQIVEAHRYLESNQQFGKIVVTL